MTLKRAGLLALIGAVCVVLSRVLFGMWGQAIGIAVFAAIMFGATLPTVYPTRWWKFWFKVPTRIAYRRAGTRDWTDAAELHLHGVTPADVAALAGVHDRKRYDAVHHLAFALPEAKHPDGPLAVQVLLRCDASNVRSGVLEQLLDLDPEQRTDVIAYLDGFDGLVLRDVIALVQAGLPLPLARRVAEQATDKKGYRARSLVLRFASVWSNPQVREALGIDGDSGAARGRLAEHLHEWIDAAPAEATAAVGSPSRTVDLITSYGTIPLAGWWYAAGYSPAEARATATKHDWSIGQLAALAALRQGPPVVSDPAA